MKAAGFGTTHPRVGRCRFHEGSEEGLPPWIGEMGDEEWRELTGGRERPGVANHGASTVQRRVGRGFEDLVRSLFSEEDRVVYDSVDVDPVVVIDQEVRLNRVAAYKVHRRLRELQMIQDADEYQVGGGVRDAEVRECEASLMKISSRLARLLEVRVRYSELADSRQNRDELTDLLRGLGHEEFLKLRQEPHRLPEVGSVGLAEA